MEKQAILAAIIDSSEDAIISKTIEGYITSWNQAAERMFGYREEEVIGKHISILIPKDRLNEEDMIIDCVRHGQRIQHFRTIRLRKDGHLLPISLTVSPVKSRDGSIIGASKIARDISELLAVQEEKARLYEQVRTLNDKKDEFIGLASHELKTPLTTIMASLQLTQRMLPDDTSHMIKNTLAKTKTHVDKLGYLITDLLDASKISSGEIELAVHPFDLNAMVTDVVNRLQKLYDSYTFRINGFASNYYMGDKTRLEQVMLHLLTNSIKFSPPGSMIYIHLSRLSDFIKISITDTGLGVDYAYQKKIFDTFFRVDEIQKQYPGIGIGLYISNQIIKKHKGTLWVESTIGEGATFSFTLPLKYNV